MGKISTEIKWALIFVVTSLTWVTAEKLAGMHDEHIDVHMLTTSLFAIPALLIYVLALLEKRKKSFGGFMTYKQGFLSGMIITLIITALSPVSQVIKSLVITPDYFANMIQYTVDHGLLLPEDAAAEFNLTRYIKGSIFGAFFMGTITAAILAFFTKKLPNGQ
ncbi:MAG: DUF4199 domain-containing protein [Flavobacteriales bacterium]|nr:DUF4199 domain-containing protein [Flavobacteriales bacterium]